MKTFDEYKQGKEKAIFDAVWQYIVDHAEIDGNGVYFVKFHTDGKEVFARRINKRMKGLYRVNVNDTDERAKIKRQERIKSAQDGMKKVKKSEVAKNLMEIQKNHKTEIIRLSWYEKLFNRFRDYLLEQEN